MEEQEELPAPTMSAPSYQTPQRMTSMVPPMAPHVRRCRCRCRCVESPVLDEEKTSKVARALFEEYHGKEEERPLPSKKEQAQALLQEVTPPMDQMKKALFKSICRSILLLSPNESVDSYLTYEEFLATLNGKAFMRIRQLPFEECIHEWFLSKGYLSRTGRVPYPLYERLKKIDLFLQLSNRLLGEKAKLIRLYPLYESWNSSLPEAVRSRLNRYQRMEFFLSHYKYLF